LHGRGASGDSRLVRSTVAGRGKLGFLFICKVSDRVYISGVIRARARADSAEPHIRFDCGRGNPESRIEPTSIALEMTRVALGLTDHHGNGIIAKRIAELAKAGERNPGRLCEGALEKLRGHLFGD